MMKKVFDGQTSNGSSLTVEHCGGEVEVVVGGTNSNFGGGKVTLEAYYSPIGDWVPVYEGVWDAADGQSVKILRTIRKCNLRLTLSGASGANLDAWI